MSGSFRAVVRAALFGLGCGAFVSDGAAAAEAVSFRLRSGATIAGSRKNLHTKANSRDVPGFLPEFGNPQEGSYSPADYGAILRAQVSPRLDHECMRHNECATDHSQFCGFPPKKWWSQAHLTGEYIYTAACLPCRLCVPVDTPGHPMSAYNGVCPPCEAEAHLLGKYAPTGDEK